MTYYNYFGSEKAADFILYVDVLYNEAYYIITNNYDEDRIRKNQKKRTTPCGFFSDFQSAVPCRACRTDAVPFQHERNGFVSSGTNFALAFSAYRIAVGRGNAGL